MSDGVIIRRATSGEVWDDLLFGDTWILDSLDVDPSKAVESATRHWGPASTSVLPGELLWRLRASGLPVYVSVCGEEERPRVMFNLQCQPDHDLERAIVERLVDLLSSED